MSAIKNISIPQACHESWQQMESRNNGRFCMQCSKTVIDFSKMTNDEIIGYLSTVNNNVCGRFGSNQLNTFNQDINKDDVVLIHAWRRWFVAIGLFGATMFMKANAQTSTILPPKMEQTDSNSSRGAIMGKIAYTGASKTKTIKGRVLDETNIPVPGATIKVWQSNVGATTNAAGDFSINVPESTSRISVSYIGYYTQDVTLDSNPTYEVKLKPSSMTMGEVMIVRQSFLRRNYNRFIRRPIRKIFH